VQFQILSVVLLFTPAVTAFGQTAHRAPTGPDEPMNLRVLVDPATSPSDLLDLIRHSKVILDGRIQSLLPTVDISRKTNPVLGSPVLETDVVVNVDTVFFGTIPNNSGNIVIPQSGGDLGKWHTSVPQDPLVVPGERYIFFLTQDYRKSVPNPTGLPRYWAVGVWAGKFKVINGVVNVSPYAGKGLTALNGGDVNSFLQLLRSRIQQPYTEADKQAPIMGAPK
jgi:hypothetical protein